MNQRTNEQGFTIIELLATVVIAAIFLVSAYQLVSTISLLSITSSQTSVADNLAYANMRQYANGHSPTWFLCEDLVNNTTGLTPGDSIPDVQEQISTSGSYSGLPGTVTQQVAVSAPYGCAGASSGLPLRVQSTVTFGSGPRKVVHSTYVSY